MGCLCKRKKPIKENNILDSISIENIKLKKVVMDDFDEEKAKELAKELLSIDLQFYRNQIYDVINLDSNEFRKLFEGKSDYIYKVRDQDNFKKLAIKFENFKPLLNEWYKKDNEYHVCLKQLWKNFVNLYDLKDLDEEEIEKKLKYTNYKNWKEEIKQEFRIIIRDSTKLPSEFLNFVETEFKELDSVIKELKKAKKSLEKIEKKDNSNNFCIKENIDMIISTILESVFPSYLEKIKKEGDDDSSKTKELSTNAISQIIKNVIKTYITGEISKDFNWNETLKNISGLIDQFGGAKYFIPLIKDNYKSITNNNYTAYGILGLSYINLCYNIISTYVFLDNSKTKITELEKRLKNIKKKFNIHKDEVDLLNLSDIEDSMRKIETIRLRFEEDKFDIEILIQDIQKEIEEHNSQKKNKYFKIFTNLGMMGFNTILAKDTLKCEYGISAVFNVVSAATDVVAISEIGKNIEKLQKLLEEAKEEEKKIIEAIEELKKKYKECQSIKPLGYKDK